LKKKEMHYLELVRPKMSPMLAGSRVILSSTRVAYVFNLWHYAKVVVATITIRIPITLNNFFLSMNPPPQSGSHFTYDRLHPQRCFSFPPPIGQSLGSKAIAPLDDASPRVFIPNQQAGFSWLYTSHRGGTLDHQTGRPGETRCVLD